MFGNFIRQQHNKVGAVFICLGAAGAGYSGYLYFTLPHTLPVVAGLFVTTALSGMTGLAGFSITGNRILPDWLRRAPENAAAPPMNHALHLHLRQVARDVARVAPWEQHEQLQDILPNPAPRPLVLHHEQPQAQEQQAPIVPAPAAKKAPAQRIDLGVSR